MTVEELRARLQREGFRQDWYSLDGSLPAFEGLVLKEERPGQWTIEYCERGMCRMLDVLGSEAAACERMYERLSADFRS